MKLLRFSLTLIYLALSGITTYLFYKLNQSVSGFTVINVLKHVGLGGLMFACTLFSLTSAIKSINSQSLIKTISIILAVLSAVLMGVNVWLIKEAVLIYRI